MGTGVKDRWIETWASAPTNPAAPTTSSTSRTARATAPRFAAMRSPSTSGRGRAMATDDMERGLLGDTGQDDQGPYQVTGLLGRSSREVMFRRGRTRTS